MRCVSLLVLALCASAALAQCTTSSCQQTMQPTQVLLVPVTQAPTCPQAVQQSTCCKTPQSTCCNKPCYVEPEYKAEECQRRSVSVCCSKPAQSCCNMGCATFLEAQAESKAETETEQCPEIVRVNTCCQAQQTNACCNPAKICTPPPPVSKIGDMKMGLLQLPNCTVAVNDRPCCSPVVTSCCNALCGRQIVKADIAPTLSACPPPTSRPCCTATVSSCCNQCAAPAAAPAPAPALVEAESEEEQCPTCALAPSKPMVPAKVLGACDQPPCGQLSMVNTCSESVKAMTCCKAATDSCCSKPCTYIGQMQMGKLCDAQQAATTCCTAATSSCCNRQRTC